MVVRIEHGDCREVIKTLADCSIHAVVTDPPYSLQTIHKRFAKVGRNDKTWSKSGPHQRTARGFMNQLWDTGEVAHDPEFWGEVYRVMKPGAHLVAFGGTRTHHRLVCAIEDAGFEIRDTIGFLWSFGTGFPKSHDVAKAIDKAARGVPHGGADPTSANHGKYKTQATEGARAEGDTGQGYGAGPGQFMLEQGSSGDRDLVGEAQPWIGWGTALKPAFEPIVLARKPLDGTVAENVLQYGTGALNIDGCRIGYENDRADPATNPLYRVQNSYRTEVGSDAGGANISIKPDGGNVTASPLGRWPANLVHDGSDEVLACFPDSAGQQGDVSGLEPSGKTDDIYGSFKGRSPAKARREGEASSDQRYTGEGSTNFAALPGARREATSAARFFFSAKADKEDRWGSRHPTVKPIDLIRWLIRMVTPPGGTILDPFAGSGTAGVAALAEGADAILIEREDKYVEDIRARMAFYEGQGGHSVAVKARAAVPRGTLPLFEEGT